jgi:hypothetical protein
MRVGLVVVVIAASVLVLGGCASGPAATPVASSPDVDPSPTSVPAAAATPTEAPTGAPTQAPTQPPRPTASPSGPVVLSSSVYPYTLTVSSGPTSFVASRVPWDGSQKLSSDSRETDRARAAGLAMWIAMTDTTVGFDAFAKDLEAKFRSWHGCKPATGRREFAAGELQGVAFLHSCASGAQTFVRAILVGDGHGIVVYSQGGTVDDLIGVLMGLELTSAP